MQGLQLCIAIDFHLYHFIYYLLRASQSQLNYHLVYGPLQLTLHELNADRNIISGVNFYPVLEIQLGHFIPNLLVPDCFSILRGEKMDVEGLIPSSTWEVCLRPWESSIEFNPVMGVLCEEHPNYRTKVAVLLGLQSRLSEILSASPWSRSSQLWLSRSGFFIAWGDK